MDNKDPLSFFVILCHPELACPVRLDELARFAGAKARRARLASAMSRHAKRGKGAGRGFRIQPACRQAGKKPHRLSPRQRRGIPPTNNLIKRRDNKVAGQISKQIPPPTSPRRFAPPLSRKERSGGGVGGGDGEKQKKLEF